MSTFKPKLVYLPPAYTMPSGVMDEYPAQPVLALLKGNKTLTKLVPITPLLPEVDKCIGCIAENTDVNKQRVDCFDLPQCDRAVYVRANPANLLRYAIWRLENEG